MCFPSLVAAGIFYAIFKGSGEIPARGWAAFVNRAFHRLADRSTEPHAP